MKDNNKLFIIIITTLILIISFLLINKISNYNKGDLKPITFKEIQEKKANKEDFILIVSQSTCSHCASYKPKVKQIAKEHGITVYYIDIDLEKKEDEVIKELHITGETPMTLFYLEGKETSILNRIVGDLGTEKNINQFKKLGFIN